MKAVILAGGQGTRMGEFTKEIPKPMLEVGGMPILEHQIKLLKKYGIDEVIVLVNYLKDSIIDYFGNGDNFGIKISYFEEKEPLGTTGGIKEIEDKLSDDFLVFYGDVMIDMHVGRFIDFHKQHKSECTLVLHPNDHPFDSDLVETDQNHKVVAFFPKPHPEGMFYKNLVNAGAYIFSPAIFKYIEKGVKSDFGRKIFPKTYDKIKMYGYNTAEYLKDMGTPERWDEVEQAYTSGKIERSNYEQKQKAIFLDRDGVINVEKSFMKTPDELEVFEFTPDAIKTINKTDYKAIVVTNQSAIARNITDFKGLAELHKKMETILGNQGAKIDELYFCPHHPDKGYPEERVEYKIECDCRKPKPGMLRQAAKDFNIDLSRSFIIGDTERDILAGKNGGCYTVGVRTGYGVKATKTNPDFFFENLKEASDFITSEAYDPLFQNLLADSHKTTKRPYIIAIAGNARSGKSNLAAWLKMRFEQEGDKVLKIELDNWLLPEEERSEQMNVFDRFQLVRFSDEFSKMLSGETIRAQTYINHKQRVPSDIEYEFLGQKIIIIEGVVALSDSNIREKANKSIFVNTSEEKRKARIKDYYYWRGKNDSQIDAIYNSRLLDEYHIIEKESKFADLIIEN